MNILFGLYHPDEGEIFIHGKKAAIANPNDAYALGIGMVHQHFMLVNQLTVLENIIIGKEQGGLFLDPKKCEEKVSELINRFGFQIDLHEKVVNLSVGMRQRVEILKTVYRGANIIILDEPTAVLTPQEVEELFKILRQLKKDGKTIIFITHKLNETMSLSDRITVIRKGKVVFRCKTADTDEKELNIFGGWQLVGSLLAGLVFAVAQAARFYLTDLSIPSQIVQMLPYIITLLILLFVGKRVKGPEALGKLVD